LFGAAAPVAPGFGKPAAGGGLFGSAPPVAPVPSINTAGPPAVGGGLFGAAPAAAAAAAAAAPAPSFGGSPKPATPAAASASAEAAAAPVALASGVVPSGPFKGQERAAALQSLNIAFARDLSRFVDEAAPDSVDLSSCMRQYLGLSAEIKGC